MDLNNFMYMDDDYCFMNIYKLLGLGFTYLPKKSSYFYILDLGTIPIPYVYFEIIFKHPT